MKKECKHLFLCDGGYGRKRCVMCDKIVEEKKENKDADYNALMSDQFNY